MRIEQIWRYPVKSLGGERLDSAEITEHGILGDRAWGVRDDETGLVLTGRREPALLFLSARYRPGGRPLITCDDGGDLADDESLSAWLGRRVTLAPASDGPGTFENPMNVDDETDWIQWQSQGSTFHDGHWTVSFVSTASLGDWDPRRFRANLVLDGSGETELRGEIRAGSAGLHTEGSIPRCVMVTRAQPGLPKDVSVLKRVIAEHDNLMAVGAVVTDPGTIRVGDEFG